MSKEDLFSETGTTITKQPYTILGLDIGIGSCGWALLDMNNHRIVDMNAHLWDVPQEDKTKVSLASKRRAARSARRNTQRTADRKKHGIALFKQYGLMPEEADAAWLQTVKGDLQPLESRVAGLGRVLTPREFAQALYNILSRRGYIPHGGADDADPDAGKVKKALQENERLMQEKGYETVGQLLYQEFRENKASRNKSGDYSHCITNEQLADEVLILFAKQQELGNALATNAFLDDYLACLTWQKPSLAHDERVYSTVGACVYFPEEYPQVKRAAKACPTFELCTAYERLCHTIVVSPARASEQLSLFGEPSAAEGSGSATAGISKTESHLPGRVVEKAIGILFSPIALKGNKNCVVRYSDLRKWLDLPSGAFFKGVDKEDDEVTKPVVWRKLRGSLPKELMMHFAEDRDLADRVCSALAYASSKESLANQLDEHAPELTADERAAVEALPFASKLFSDYGSRSLKAMNLLIEAFEETDAVHTLAEAEEASGLKAKRGESGERGFRLPPYTMFDQTCNNPVVLRVMGRVRRVVNAVIATYGMPDEIHVELARNLKIPKTVRDNIDRDNKKRQKKRDIICNKIAEELGCAPETVSPTLVRKVELWNEQRDRDIYTGNRIDYERMLRDDTYCQIDHILPYSRTCDDSQMNKVLVLSSSNQDKRERTPYEWLNATGRWEEFSRNVESLRKDSGYPRKKIERLLETDLSGERQQGFIERNLNDTRYASRNAALYLDRYLQFPDNGRKKHVGAVSGGATSALRSAWGFAKKDREASDTHHAVDAAIIAACSESAVIKVAKAHEQKYSVPKDQRKQLFDASEPWEGFAADVEAFERTIIPTRMVNHKVTGRLYEDMVYRYIGMNEAGTKGLLERSGKVSSCGNYVVREDGSAIKPDGMMFLRVWWNPDTRKYLAEPVYYADLDAIRHGTYIPRYYSSFNDQRSNWKTVPEQLLTALPIVIRFGDMLQINGKFARYKAYGIATNTWITTEVRNFNSLNNVGTINSIRTKEGLKVIQEDILGLCYKHRADNATSDSAAVSEDER